MGITDVFLCSILVASIFVSAIRTHVIFIKIVGAMKNCMGVQKVHL
jgi:hypothetical protein